MKVVLFCGGLGTRLRDYSNTIPKPMVPVGHRPIIWNIMKYYAHFGHKDFILALGYKGEYIKEYFLNYKEELSNDFNLSNGGENKTLINKELEDWRITFVDTGVNSNIGMRLMKLKDILKNEDVFLANYSDGLTDMDLNSMLRNFHNKKNMIGSFMVCKPKSSLHEVTIANDGLVQNIEPFTFSKTWINAGFFIFKSEIFDYIKKDEELVLKPFKRLLKNKKLSAFRHRGFWQAMDTFKDKMILDDLKESGNAKWEIWEK